MMISRTFRHGICYNFAFDEQKIEDSYNPHQERFLDYLRALLHTRLPNGFSTPPRASGMKFPQLAQVEIEHQLKDFARYVHRLSIAGSRHERMQTFLMLSDRASVAVEVPVWMTPSESKLFDATLTGHIDIIRLTDKIEVWDYKPSASRELFACCQVYWYVRMLSTRLHLDMDEFRCGFFDAYNVYTLEPEYVPYQRTLKEFL